MTSLETEKKAKLKAIMGTADDVTSEELNKEVNKVLAKERELRD